MKQILVIGGGAAGIAAAIAAADTDPAARVVILEQQDRIGKKILVSGNGRCNLGNRNIAPDCYHTEEPELLKGYLDKMPPEMTVDFFQGLGLYCTADEAGRLYPYCRQAAMVLDVLLLALRRRGVEVLCGQTVTEITPKKGGFQVRTASGISHRADRVILTTGGKAALKEEQEAGGYTLARRLGHHSTPLRPCLCPIVSGHKGLKSLKGIRCSCGVTLFRGEKQIAHTAGELQLTDYGISGIPAMELSCYMTEGNGYSVEVDFLPDWGLRELKELLRQRRETLPDEPVETAFLGLIQKRILFALMKDCGISPLSKEAGTLTDGELETLAKAIKGWQLYVEGVLGFGQAQVTGGGISLEDVDENLASKCCPGLYLAGELLDVTGTCGGFNLHWAWCSGILAGRAAGRAVAKKQQLQ
ncbi:MAG: aminoacetone oxidase family FAD-binding enzyme [Oscillospiraceae bacterium]|nr:aminoacetone oxidase family FAD-binding enzyme [Oscillospiraceae bacterium]